MMNSLLPIRRIEAMFDDLLTPTWRFADGETSVSVTPRADILEGEKEYRIQLDLPGVAREDLAIEVEGQTLTISAKRNAQAPEGFKALHNERADVTEYRRSFTLGSGVDASHIEAKLVNGTLTVIVAKHEQALPRKIEVK